MDSRPNLFSDFSYSKSSNFSNSYNSSNSFYTNPTNRKYSNSIFDTTPESDENNEDNGFEDIFLSFKVGNKSESSEREGEAWPKSTIWGNWFELSGMRVTGSNGSNNKIKKKQQKERFLRREVFSNVKK